MRKKKKIERLKAYFGLIKENDFQFDLITGFFRNKNHSKEYQILSDKTCNDLDFDEMFMFLDRTTSKVGQQYLYNKLRSIPHNSESIAINEAITEHFTSDEDFRLKVQLQLDRLNSVEAYHLPSLFQEDHKKPPRWFFIVKLLFASSILSIALMPIIPQLFFLFLPVAITNIGIHYWNKRNLYRYSSSIPQLLKLNTIAKSLHQEQRLKELAPTLNTSIDAINKLKNRMAFFRLETGLQSEAEALFWGILEFIKIIFILEPLLLFGVLKRLDSKRKEIEKVYSFIGEIDSLISIASLRSGLETFCIPEIKGTKIETEEIYNPLILNCITNSINEKSVLLTGSNMSGKTSFIRAIGINAITALTLNTCFAKSLTMPRVQIHSAIRISDDLLNDRSYYFEEVLTIKEMIDKSSDGNNLFLLDEIFKGTNTVERISAGKAVLSKLCKNNNIVFVSTHDIELTDLLSEDCNLYHFSELVDKTTIAFDYKLKEGKLKNRNAIRILEINNYPQGIIDEALEIAKSLDEINSTKQK